MLNLLTSPTVWNFLALLLLLVVLVVMGYLEGRIHADRELDAAEDQRDRLVAEADRWREKANTAHCANIHHREILTSIAEWASCTDGLAIADLPERVAHHLVGAMVHNRDLKIKTLEEEMAAHREASARLIEVAQDERDYMHSLLTRAHQHIPLTDILWAEVHNVIRPPNPEASAAAKPSDA